MKEFLFRDSSHFDLERESTHGLVLRSSHDALRVLYTYIQYYERAPADKKPKPADAIKILQVRPSLQLFLVFIPYSNQSVNA